MRGAVRENAPRLFCRKVLRLKKLCALILLSTVALAGEREVDITPTTGRYFRPGQWVQVMVEAVVPPGMRGNYIPELAVISAKRKKFVSRMGEMLLGEGYRYSFSFYILPEDSCRLRFSLLPVDGDAIIDFPESENSLSPVPPGRRLFLHLTDEPAAAFAQCEGLLSRRLPKKLPGLAGADLLVMGAPSRVMQELPDREQMENLLDWLLGGGVMLVCDARLWRMLETTVTGRGLRQAVRKPFVLPEKYGVDQRADVLTACDLGLGTAVYLCGDENNSLANLRKQALWHKLNNEYFRTRATDSRLAKKRYDAFGSDWPPPRISRVKLWRFLGAWLALIVTTALIATAAKRRVQFTTIGFLLVSIGLGLVFKYREHPEQIAVYQARIREAGALGAVDLSRDEELWCVVPFADRRELVLAFTGMPPLMQHYSHGEMRSISLMLEMNGGDGRLSCLSDGFARGMPLLFSRRTIGGKLARPDAVCARKQDKLGVTGRIGIVLRDAELFIADGGARFATLESAGGFAKLERHFAPISKTARRRFVQAISREHLPGSYATLLGWGNPGSDETDSGELLIYSLPLLPR
jgi:hypothetical protein